MKFVWFSQQIDKGRGLELILPVLDQFRDQIELHLIGNPKKQFEEEFLEERKFIFLHNTMPQSELHIILSEYDVGLALEPGKDLNNKLAISNKIFAYAQAGLHVLATD